MRRKQFVSEASRGSFKTLVLLIRITKASLQAQTHQSFSTYSTRWRHVCYRKDRRIHETQCVHQPVCLSLNHMERGVCVRVCISPLPRERGLLQHDSGSAGPRSCLSHVPGVAMATEDCKTDAHTHIHAQAKHILSRCLFSPHTHSRSSPAAERCNRNTEELARLCWGEALHNTGRIQKMPGEKGKQREERTAGEREERGAGTRESKLTITWCSWLTFTGKSWSVY